MAIDRAMKGASVKSWISIACALGVLLTAAPAARAFDATGTWIGQYSCKSRDIDGKFTFKAKPSTAFITQVGSAVRINLDSEFFYQGTAFNDAKKPDEKGEVFVVECATDFDATTGFAETLRAAVKTKPAKGTGSLSGLSVYQDLEDVGLPEFGTCKFKYKRVDTADPGVGGCM